MLFLFYVLSSFVMYLSKILTNIFAFINAINANPQSTKIGKLTIKIDGIPKKIITGTAFKNTIINVFPKLLILIINAFFIVLSNYANKGKTYENSNNWKGTNYP